jgi:type 1 fimbriae regulatory protein FimB/type 1 fimbriae regulatory protein FimE
LTPGEVARLLAAAGKLGRHGHRDETLLLLAYRHGLRVSELAALRWNQVDLKAGLLHVARLKNGIDSVHPLRGPELRALRRLQREYEQAAYVFITERGGPMTPDGVRKVIQRAGEQARLGFPVHPHMLRHSCGYKLANDGHDTRAIQHYLGHKNIQHTVRYTELAPTRFKNFWRD